MNTLIPKDQLVRYENLIRPLYEESYLGFPDLANDPVSGEAFRYALLFSEPTVWQQTALSNLTELEIFYNRYYWFLLFTKLHEISHGKDGGMDQQADKILDRNPENVDWLFVEEIIKRAEREASSYNQK